MKRPRRGLQRSRPEGYMLGNFYSRLVLRTNPSIYKSRTPCAIISDASKNLFLKNVHFYNFDATLSDLKLPDINLGHFKKHNALNF